MVSEAFKKTLRDYCTFVGNIKQLLSEVELRNYQGRGLPFENQWTLYINWKANCYDLSLYDSLKPK
jgi:hypothetical protein